jgi:Fe-S-cluster containining protein
MAKPQSPTTPTRGHWPFRPDLKCCTHFPFLPNFTVGELLLQQNPQVLSAMSAGHVSPLGLAESSEYAQLRDSLGLEGFGRDERLRCPFLESNACSIWEYRPSVCSSYFCVSQQGQDFWQKEDSRLRRFEWAMAHLVLWKSGFTGTETKQIAATGEWPKFGEQKPDFFIRCREISLGISKAEITRHLGDLIKF